MAKLTEAQHRELARLLNQAAANIRVATHIVHRAACSDRSLYVGGSLQEWLIDPLADAWEAAGLPLVECPYQSIGYGGPPRKRPPAANPVPR